MSLKYFLNLSNFNLVINYQKIKQKPIKEANAMSILGLYYQFLNNFYQFQPLTSKKYCCFNKTAYWVSYLW